MVGTAFAQEALRLGASTESVVLKLRAMALQLTLASSNLRGLRPIVMINGRVVRCAKVLPVVIRDQDEHFRDRTRIVVECVRKDGRVTHKFVSTWEDIVERPSGRWVIYFKVED